MRTWTYSKRAAENEIIVYCGKGRKRITLNHEMGRKLWNSGRRFVHAFMDNNGAFLYFTDEMIHADDVALKKYEGQGSIAPISFKKFTDFVNGFFKINEEMYFVKVHVTTCKTHTCVELLSVVKDEEKPQPVPVVQELPFDDVLAQYGDEAVFVEFAKRIYKLLKS